MILKRQALLLLWVVPLGLSCKKLVDVPPPSTAIATENVFTNDQTAVSAITGIYSRMAESAGFGSGSFGSVSFLCGYSADELTPIRQNDDHGFYANELTPTNGTLFSQVWNPLYKYIYTSNKIIEGLTNNEVISDGVRDALTGEAAFIRAFCYFYAVNLWGDVPLITSSDYRLSASALRTPSAEAYDLIISDLKVAIEKLPEGYLDAVNQPTELRVRPNRAAAMTLLARVYLYLKDWQEAASLATAVIDDSTRYTLDKNLEEVFLKSSKEEIWQLMPTLPGRNTNEADAFVPAPGSLPIFAVLTASLVSSFEQGDRRRSLWIDSVATDNEIYYYPFKYQIRSGSEGSEYSSIFRLAELYLIRAEALIELGNIQDGIKDINTIRTRASDSVGLPMIAASSTAEEALNAVLTERQHELFAEWGHRWLDIKRRGLANHLLGPIKPSWQPSDSLYPIPEAEITVNPNIAQNPGY